MKIKWYTNACVRITTNNGTNILCDPWVNSGAFLGSWFHWPPILDDFESYLLSAPCDGIYISHLHPDHYDPNFLAKFSKARPDVPIYVAEFAHPWLLRSVRAIAGRASKVIEIPAMKPVSINNDLVLKVFPADTCNPAICGSNIPCELESSLRGIDSVGVFYADDFVIVNANDAMSIALVPQIAANIGDADLIMGHYGGASPYPQCFPDIEDKIMEAKKVVHSTCDALVTAAHALKAKYIFPFAGQYVLGGRLVKLNQFRATIPLDEAVRYLSGMTNAEILSVKPFGEIDFERETKDTCYVEPTETETIRYFENISTAKFPYEKNNFGNLKNIEFDLLGAANSVAKKSRVAKIPFANSFVIGDGKNFVTINLNPDFTKCSVDFGNQPKSDDVTEITMPEMLLKQLSTRRADFKGFTPMHWNQADVGSHFEWKRNGRYDLKSHSLLNFFGT